MADNEHVTPPRSAPSPNVIFFRFMQEIAATFARRDAAASHFIPKSRSGGSLAHRKWKRHRAAGFAR